ncbi:MAG: hypothetical protein HY329_13515 [Chloroflexi bacterium]|nr:hypothetical protein [Chloroflexota bacterium]
MLKSRVWLLATVALVFAIATAGQHAVAAPEPSFVDPTARSDSWNNVRLGHLVYVGPFANLGTGGGLQQIQIGDESNVQDNVDLDATNGSISLGDEVILAHGATVTGPASIGIAGFCPDGKSRCPSFVSFNAVVDGAMVEKDAMVGALAYVMPGVRVPSGWKIDPGVSVANDNEVMLKGSPVTGADREFMNGVIHVNVDFARGYSVMAGQDPNSVRGIGRDPGNSSFNARSEYPMLAGAEARDPSFRNRIIGGVKLADTRDRLNSVMGSQVAVRADEGEDWQIGTIASMSDRTTLHALEHSHLSLGNNGRYGFHSVVHGGATPWKDTTITMDNVTVGAWSVLFRSRVGADSVIGFKSVVQQSDLPAGTIVPDRVIVVNNQIIGYVEW